MVVLCAMETVHAVFFGVSIPFDDVGRLTYAAACVAMVGTMVAVHLAPVVIFVRFLSRRFTLRSEWVWPLVALLFGVSWQNTLVQGDGFRASEHYVLMRTAYFVLLPIVFAVCVRFVCFGSKRTLPWRRWIMALGLVCGIAVNVSFELTYRQFHGHLALCAAVLSVWLLWPLLQHDKLRRVTVGLGVLILLSIAAVLPFGEGALRYVGALSHIPMASAQTLPGGGLVIGESAFFVRFDGSGKAGLYPVDTPGDFGALAPPRDPEDKVKNVLLFVLESTRSDTWSDPEIAPRFDKWRANGLYLPDSVAQYPATPLAYGGMFSSQSPSVLALSSYWAEHRLFDHIRDRFDEHIYTRPKTKWFDRTTITDFFLPRDAVVHKHKNSKVGLRTLRKKVKASIKDGDSFFGWVHLYEPHKKWRSHKGFDFGESKREKYLSEVAYMDNALGKFMKWFYEQPAADETLVIVIADHGEGLGEKIDGKKFFYHHVHVHNVISRIPAFVSGPGIPTGRVIEGQHFSHLDVMPTIFDALDVPLPERLLAQGRSLYSTLQRPSTRDLVTEAFNFRGKEFFNFLTGGKQGDAVRNRERLTAMTADGKYAPKIALAHWPHKLVCNRRMNRCWLYDISVDQDERNDLSKLEPEQFSDMQRRLNRWLELQGRLVDRLDELYTPPPDKSADAPANSDTGTQ
ncbi:MAG TPA: hypothetical protein DIU15_11220 [Deltaproteobacteria bacterium]|nr:hypothetical protein [Deltaproteobacteria bacterium]HCP46608.1 hypothetical protein [Deltaproteobacteria bacterium]